MHIASGGGGIYPPEPATFRNIDFATMSWYSGFVICVRRDIQNLYFRRQMVKCGNLKGITNQHQRLLPLNF